MTRHLIPRSLLLGLAVWCSACGGEATTTPAQDTGLDRETFIATYVDLRTAVIRGDSVSLSDRDRARILSDHGVSEEELLDFVEDHGTDVAFMRGVWDEVEARLDGVRLVPGSEDPR